MKEEPLEILPEAAQSGRLGFAACSYACPGCPRSRDEAALRVRIVGWSPALADSLVGHSRRDLELASGDLPRDLDSWRTLAEVGIRRVYTPFFCGRLESVSEEQGELEQIHDTEAGRAGAAACALEALSMAKAAGIAAGILAVSDRAGYAASASALRVLNRLAWAHRVTIQASSGGEPPCIAAVRDYNQLHL